MQHRWLIRLSAVAVCISLAVLTRQLGWDSSSNTASIITSPPTPMPIIPANPSIHPPFSVGINFHDPATQTYPFMIFTYQSTVRPVKEDFTLADTKTHIITTRRLFIPVWICLAPLLAIIFLRTRRQKGVPL